MTSGAWAGHARRSPGVQRTLSGHSSTLTAGTSKAIVVSGRAALQRLPNPPRLVTRTEARDRRCQVFSRKCQARSGECMGEPGWLDTLYRRQPCCRTLSLKGQEIPATPNSRSGHTFPLPPTTPPAADPRENTRTGVGTTRLPLTTSTSTTVPSYTPGFPKLRYHSEFPNLRIFLLPPHFRHTSLTSQSQLRIS